MKKQNFVLFFIIYFLSFSSLAFTNTDRVIVNLGGSVPFYTGMNIQYNWSTQIYTILGAGFALELFRKPHNQLLNTLDISKNAELFTYSFVNSIVIDARIGWTRSIYEGPFVEVGYNYMLWGKGDLIGQDINNFSKINIPSKDEKYKVNIQNHGPSFHLGYRFILVDRLTLTIDAGVYKPWYSIINLDKKIITTDKQKLKIEIQDLLKRRIIFLSLGIWLGFAL